ncbi:MAG: 2-oxo acid dehydrogenase subunit E2 [Arthrobacter sp.]|nr:2-oxo acid dehydrogenase subunit E2 [Arthrobacter sp.]
MSTFNLPDVGEGLTEADIVEWKVAVGDTVAVNQVLVEIETAKSLVELPSPFAGVVTRLHAEVGQTLPVDEPLIDIAEEGQAAPEAPVGAAHDAALPGTAHDDASPGPLVGSGPVADAVKRRPRVRQTGAGAPARPAAVVPPEPTPVDRTVAPSPTRALAKPPVRRLAKELGVDLAQVPATGPRGEVTREDLADFAEARLGTRAVSAPAPAPVAGGQALSAAFGGEAWQAPEDAVEIVPVKGVRKATAAAMVGSAFTAPHVSLFVDVDATRTMEFVKRLKASRDFQGVKVTPLLIVAKAVLWAAARNPQLNASWVDTPAGAQIHVKRFVNLGIAAATPRGLIVPNIKDAQELSLKELAGALEQLSATAREGKTPPADMRDGTITITNVGTLGVDTGTPILNPGEVAIIAFGTVRQRAWVVDGEVVPRYVTTVGGSFDHRVVDGDQCARFLADVASILEEPALLLD